LRDAALSLNKVHASKSSNGTEHNNTELDAANLKVQTAQSALTKLQDECNVVQKRLFEHRAAVLSYSLARLESLLKPAQSSTIGLGDCGRTTPANNGLRDNNAYAGESSPTSAVTNMSLSSRARFEGAHLFAGHAEAKLPNMPKPLRSLAQVAVVEEQLANVEEQLRAVNTEKEELAREAETLRAERSRESAKLAEADTTISGLRSELFRMNSTGKKVRSLEDEKRQWEEQRTKMESEL